MKNTLGVLAIFILLVAGAMLFSGCGQKVENTGVNTEQAQKEIGEEPNNGDSISAKPWIQVVKDGVFKTTSGTEKNTLKTGDEIGIGDAIETDGEGLANIYFPDGSVARLDNDTKIIIDESSYDAGDKTLIVRIKLAAGNVWSKIIKLATPESVWEVKTTNAVAAVRGTAFGMGYKNGSSRIIGSEHTVEVHIINPSAGEIIEGQQADVTDGKMIVINQSSMPNYIKGTRSLVQDIKSISATVSQEEWIKRSEEADIKINIKIQSLEQGGLTNDQALAEYRGLVAQERNVYTRVNAEPVDAGYDSSTYIDDSGAINLLDVGASGAGIDTSAEIIIEPETGSNATPTNFNAR